MDFFGVVRLLDNVGKNGVSFVILYKFMLEISTYNAFLTKKPKLRLHVSKNAPFSFVYFFYIIGSVIMPHEIITADYMQIL